MAEGERGAGSGEGLGTPDSDRRVPDEGKHDHTDGRSRVDDLIILVLSGNASPFDEERLKRWRDTNPENEAYVQEMMQVWNLTAPEPVAVSASPPSVEEILAAAPPPHEAVDGSRTSGLGMDEGAPSPQSKVRPLRGRPSWLGWVALAASVAAVGLGIRSFQASGPEPRVVHSAPGEAFRTVTLLDGSFARLAPGAILQEWEVEGRREVSLRGRVFFAVARKEERPFLVRAQGSDIRVLGTRFQVEAGEEKVEAVVVEGLVRLSNDEGSVEVPAGHVAEAREGSPPLTRGVSDVFAYLDWEEGALLYQATPLAQVAAEVSHYYGRTVSIQDSALARRRVTAWFEGETFEAVTESLCLVTEAECRQDGQGVRMELPTSGGGR